MSTRMPTVMRLVPVLLSLMPALVGAQSPRMVRVAYTAFEPSRTGENLTPIVKFLTKTARKLCESPPHCVEFEVTVGNYYQVWSWFRERQIDAALVSPFTAYLLERDGTALPVLELPEGIVDGQETLIAASGKGAADPRAAYDSHLQSLLDGESHSRLMGQPVRVNFVAHLSTSGFIMPVAYAAHWLRKRNVPPEVSERFWMSFFERARFQLHHGLVAPPSVGALTEIYFSKSERSRTQLAGDAARARLGVAGRDAWQKLRGTAADWDAPLIPNDVLIVRRRLLEELIGTDDREQLAETLVQAARASGGFATKTPYTEVRRYNTRVHAAFREALDGLFSDRARDLTLRRLGQQWFDAGEFDFTISETLGFLRQDQRTSGVSRLSLVLSGGGVKSVYQAQLLDHLYGGDLRNAGGTERDENKHGDQVEPRLVVHSVIGTSGGAMLAFFASLLPTEGISSLKEVAESTASKTLFPPVDVPRVVSIVATVIVFIGLLHCAKATGSLRPPLGSRQEWRVDRGLTLLLAAPLLVVALTLFLRMLRVPHLDGARFVRGVEGLLFGVAAVLVHMIVVCVRRPRETSLHATPLAAEGASVGWLGVSLCLTALALRFTVAGTDPSDRALAWMPVLGLSGVVLGLVGVLVAAAGHSRGLTILRAREYSAALAVVLGVVGITSGALWLLSVLGPVPFLEIVPVFWMWTLGFAGFATSMCLGLVRLGGRLAALVHLGIYTLVRDRVGGLTLSLGAGMAGFSATTTVVWIMLVAPALYGGERAYEALETAVPKPVLRSETFKADLIVTGALLTNTACEAQRTEYLSGPLYSCFEGSGGCIARSKKWHIFRRPSAIRALEAVFASGSPFPVFPAQKVALPDGCVVPLVDGGYAHNVPLEAAVDSEARQVLVIHATPRPSATVQSREQLLWQVTSELGKGAPRILAFMFSQAQEVDRTVARRLMVASLAPSQSGEWPFLLDFRPETIARVGAHAQADVAMKRRIGRIDVWGTPVVYRVIRASAGGTTEPD